MSCRYRSKVYRKTVRTDESGSDHAWDHRLSHPSKNDLPAPIAATAPPHVESLQTTVPSLPWQILRDILHAPSDAERMWSVVCYSHLLVSGGWSGFPTLTDADIAALWQVVTKIMVQQQTAQLFMRPDDGAIGTAFCHLVRWCAMAASAQLRYQMWEDIRNAMSKAMLIDDAECTHIALRWKFPLWMIPDCITILATGFRSDWAPDIIDAFRNALSFWRSSVDPKMAMNPETAMTMHRLLTDVFGPMLRQSNPRVQQFSLLFTIDDILSVNPYAFFVTPGLADTIFTACSSPSFAVANAALGILGTVRPYTHPRFRPTMEAVIEQSDIGEICQQAAQLLMASFQFDPDPSDLHRIMDTVYQRLINPNRSPDEHRRAAIVLLEAIKNPITASRIRPYLRALIGCMLPDVVVHMLGGTRYASSVAKDMVALADWFLRMGNEEGANSAMVILSQAWGTGTDKSVITTVTSMTDPSLQIAVLKHGLYASDYHSDIVHLIRSIDPKRASKHILDGILTVSHTDRPLPPAVLPIVVHACVDMLPEVTPAIIDRLWATDPHAVLQVIDQIEMSGRLYDDTMIPVVSQFLLRGIGEHDGRYDPIVTRVWQQMLDYGTTPYLRAMIRRVAQHRAIWPRRRPNVLITMLQDLYTRCHSFPTKDVTALVPHILTMLSDGWGCGDDHSILDLLDRITDDVFRMSKSDTSVAVQSAVVDTVQEIAWVLRGGWGRGMDHAIAARILRLMEWLDATVTNWYDTYTGITMLAAITAGGTRELHGPVHQWYDPRTLVRARNVLKQWLDGSSTGTVGSAEIG